MTRGLLIDLENKTFGYWHVLDEYKINKKSHATLWKCQCECGAIRFVPRAALVKGRSKSCGCKTSFLRTEKLRKAPGLAAQKAVYYTYKREAKERKLSFSLKFEDFVLLIQNPCCHCGSVNLNTHKNRFNNGDFSYTGLDRVDSKKGYSLENVVPCCKICNRAKGNLSLKDFIAWAKNLSTKLFLKPSAN